MTKLGKGTFETFNVGDGVAIRLVGERGSVEWFKWKEDFSELESLGIANGGTITAAKRLERRVKDAGLI